MRSLRRGERKEEGEEIEKKINDPSCTTNRHTHCWKVFPETH